jgi:hypothetical protein
MNPAYEPTCIEPGALSAVPIISASLCVSCMTDPDMYSTEIMFEGHNVLKPTVRSDSLGYRCSYHA